MTETEWLACTDQASMLVFLKGRASDRKLRLFAVSCCHRVCHLMPDERCRLTVEVAERFAEGIATEQELWAAAEAAFDSADDNSVATSRRSFAVGQGTYAAARAASYAANRDAHEAAVSAARTLHTALVGAAGDPDVNTPARKAASYAVNQYQRKLLHDIFGNLFHPLPVDDAWLHWNDQTIPRLAQVIYLERAFDRLPILADALEDGGCHDISILAHCREPGEHVRGCWVVDLLLGR